MEPSLRRGDYFLVSKLPYLFGAPQRGDVVVFLTPRDEIAYVKRLVGLPGDRVQMKAGSLYLDGELVPREKVEAKSDRLGDLRGALYREALPEGPTYLIRELSDESPPDATDVATVHPRLTLFLGPHSDNPHPT